MKNIIYLGWGSLLWDTAHLKLIKNEWIKTDLKLPLEFSRISDRGRGRLTLVIDNKNGIQNNIWESHADTKNLNIAIKRLVKRENTIVKNISYYNVQTDKGRFNNLPNSLINKIKEWSKNKKYDAVIWTGLNSNWNKLRGNTFTPKDGLNYFLGSYDKIQIEIINYIYQAFKTGDITTKFSQMLFKKLSTNQILL
jgi:hypothetical protein